MALLAKERLADALPDVCGKKVTVKETDCPAARVAGSDIPPSKNSALVVAPDEMVTGEPVALRVPDRDAFDPVLTLPKFKTVGVSVNCPGVLPLPDSAMFSCGLEASETIERFPVIEPAMLGVKMTIDSPPTFCRSGVAMATACVWRISRKPAASGQASFVALQPPSLNQLCPNRRLCPRRYGDSAAKQNAPNSGWSFGTLC